MALSDLILSYMQEEFKKNGTSRFSSKMVSDYCREVRPDIKKNSVYAELSRMKGNNLIANTEEKVSDQPGAFYFTLDTTSDETTGDIEPVTKAEDSKDLIIELLNEIKGLASSHVTVDGDKLADVINKRLSDLGSDSLAYLIKGFTNLQYGDLNNRLDEIEELWRRAYIKAKDNNDYQRGIKDGIKIAIEMGLQPPPVAN